MTKHDHLKLAKRHAGHLNDKELANFAEWLRITEVTRRTLRYADMKALQSAANNQAAKFMGLPRAKRKFITFRRFEKI